ncbi:MAG: transcription antitermination factor NusB [Crocinitomicaceae bacterium]|nr:transcription antitermination factor NusB [Crocinitomicaceae bacterium]
MLTRRHLRIKVLQALYSFYQTPDADVLHQEKELLKSINKIYDLYLFYMLVFEEFKVFTEKEIDQSKYKISGGDPEKDPRQKIIKNRLINLIEGSEELRKASELKKVNWIGDDKQDLLKKMFKKAKSDELYSDYIESTDSSWEEDRTFLIEFFKKDIANSELLYFYLEEESIMWQDDIDHVCSMVIKSLKKGDEGKPFQILPLYKDEEDEKGFLLDLYRETLKNEETNSELIDQLTKNWEMDRIALMDVILMKMAVTEITKFKTIPTKVTLNEYIEISKFYSTPKSNGFINGVLDKAVEVLKDEGKLVKVGRGLME